VVNFKTNEDRPYADGKGPKVWHLFVPDVEARLANYKGTLLKILEDRGAKTVYDVACGTGLDSVMLLEEGYKVISSDASENFLNKAREARQNRPELADWQIGFGDWLDLKSADVKHPEGGYDAIICIGNSIPSLPEFEGENKTHLKALQNFKDMLKEGGVLIIDHKNCDPTLANKAIPPSSRKNIYYPNDREFNPEVEFVEKEGKVTEIILKTCLDVSGTELENDSDVKLMKRGDVMVPALEILPISMYPHTRDGFISLLKKVFGVDAEHRVLPDFQENSEDSEPKIWVHVIIKS